MSPHTTVAEGLHRPDWLMRLGALTLIKGLSRLYDTHPPLTPGCPLSGLYSIITH